MQISSTSNPTTVLPGATGTAEAAAAATVGLNGEKAVTKTPVEHTPSSAAPLRRNTSSWEQPAQDDISNAQQALDFLEQSADQLRSLKADLSAKLANRQQRDGTLDARVRQFSNSWRTRQQASGGTLDSQLSYSSEPSTQQFSIRGMTLANLRTGGREVLAISVGSNQNLRSVTMEPGLSDNQIAARLDEALAPAGVRASLGDTGELVFSTEESNWTSVRDSLSVQGGGVRFPTGQLNRVRAEAQEPAINPDNWSTQDTESMRQTLTQVVSALAQVERAIAQVKAALREASSQIEAAAEASATSSDVAMTTVGMDQVAQNFANTAKQPGYSSLMALTSALAGISRDRVVSLLGLR
ncbi:hypothetical protein ACLB1G_03135 [Oxalobacteraceae bacterium A2-2]